MSGEQFDNEMLARVAQAVPEDGVIFTLAQTRPNRVAIVDSSGVYVETGRSVAQGTGPQLVPAWMIIAAWGHLRRNGRLSQDKLLNALNVKRSALVCGLVALFPEVEVESRRPTILRIRAGADAKPAEKLITLANAGTGLERLTDHLRAMEADTVVMSFDEINVITGGVLPRSAWDHSTFWSNGRSWPYARHWRDAGFRASRRDVSDGHVMFIRLAGDAVDGQPRVAVPMSSHGGDNFTTDPERPERVAPEPDLILLGCVKAKRTSRLPARELYRSPLWRKRLNYVADNGVPWLVLSALHGLIDPVTEIDPYDVTLKTMPAAERKKWGMQVVADLERRMGSIEGMVIEVHAGMDYQRPIALLLALQDAMLVYPLKGLTQGEQLRWYGLKHGTRVESAAASAGSVQAEVSVLAEQLLDPMRRVRARDFSSIDPDSVNQPGLYSWWADALARELLGEALEVDMSELIYVGQAGATRWPSGKPSSATVGSRIRSQHLRGRITKSTFRLTLTALLGSALELVVEGSDLDVYQGAPVGGSRTGNRRRPIGRHRRANSGRAGSGPESRSRACDRRASTPERQAWRGEICVDISQRSIGGGGSRVPTPCVGLARWLWLRRAAGGSCRSEVGLRSGLKR